MSDPFWSQIQYNEEGCWPWTGYLDTNGYGRVGLKRVHRMVYEGLVGPIPKGLELDHLCGVVNCVRPSHLQPVTHRVNTLRGNSPCAENARKTHCKRGHLFDEQNTIHNRGGRECRTCRLARKRALYWRAKELSA